MALVPARTLKRTYHWAPRSIRTAAIAANGSRSARRTPVTSGKIIGAGNDATIWTTGWRRRASAGRAADEDSDRDGPGNGKEESRRRAEPGGAEPRPQRQPLGALDPCEKPDERGAAGDGADAADDGDPPRQGDPQGARRLRGGRRRRRRCHRPAGAPPLPRGPQRAAEPPEENRAADQSRIHDVGASAPETSSRRKRCDQTTSGRQRSWSTATIIIVIATSAHAIARPSFFSMATAM